MLRGGGPCALLSPRLHVLDNTLPNATSVEESTVVPEMARTEDPLRPGSTRELSRSRCSKKKQHVRHSQLTNTSRARWQHVGARRGYSGICRPSVPKDRSPLRSQREKPSLLESQARPPTLQEARLAHTAHPCHSLTRNRRFPLHNAGTRSIRDV